MNLEERLTEQLKEIGGGSIENSTDRDLYLALLGIVRELIEERPRNRGKKKVYYLSMEFLMGRLLGNNLMNLGIYDEIENLLAKYGRNLDVLEEQEAEPSLGNGGLGRLAACFLDAMATLGINGDGMGLNYHLGLFKQVFEDHVQKQEPDPWMRRSGWLTLNSMDIEVSLGNDKVTARIYDIDVIGYGGGRNKLHLFDLNSVEEKIVTSGISFDKTEISKNLTLFLYPDDSDEAGNLLRIYQEYFLAACSARYILWEVRDKGGDLHRLDEYAVIQINDTHPSLVIPELIRLLTEEESFSFEEALEVVGRTCAYTNHTILAEALEKWPIHYLEKVAPPVVPVIFEIHRRVKERYSDERLQIIDQNHRVHMARMDIHCGFSINGVAEIHTEILKQSALKDFYQIYPEKFHNETNGITFRRWLLYANRPLAQLLTELIGDDYKKNAAALQELLAYQKDTEVLRRLEAIKAENKKKLVLFLNEREGVELSDSALFDIQVKRLHEYKRQQLNVMYIIHKYLEIKEGKKPEGPITILFGAKAAPAYVMAQDIIHLILVLSELINNDTDVNSYLRVVMVENYNVTYAQRLIPACDLSEQISLASKEASGTGNMKFMLNGAVTLGTMDGANVEIKRLVGEENIYIFGQDSETVISHYEKQDYVAADYYERDAKIKRVMDFMVGKELMALGDPVRLKRLREELLRKDYFMTFLDFADYVRVKERAIHDYFCGKDWAQKMLCNIANAGYFSADRCIEGYNRDIWKIEGSCDKCLERETDGKGF